MAIPHEFGERRRSCATLVMVLLMVGHFVIFIRHEKNVLAKGKLKQSSLRMRRLLLEKKPAVDMDALDAASSFSSCLLVGESDLDKISEWIAYHYYTMPLRYLVFLPDPIIEDVANRLVRKWTSLMEIVPWTDKNWIGSTNATATVARRANEDEFQFRARREAAFYYKCAAHMQKNKKSMVSFQKANEYAAINEEMVTNAKKLLQQSGSILTLLNYAHAIDVVNSSCVTTHSVLFSPVESRLENSVDENIPSFLKGLHLDTLEFQRRESAGANKIGKALLNVSAIDGLYKLSILQREGKYQFSPVCPPTRRQLHPIVHMHVYPINAGIGSKAPIQYDEIVQVNEAVDDVSSWLNGFVDRLGPSLATALLRA